MREAEYVGVRRFIRALDKGMDSKAFVDHYVDRCAAVVNLRTAIMRYRKPRGSFRFYRYLFYMPCPLHAPMRDLASTPYRL